MNPTQPLINGDSNEAQAVEQQAEIERLRKSLQAAETRIQELEKQRDKYHEFTKVWIQQNCRLSDWDDFDPADYTLSFDDLIADVEARFKV